MNERNLKLYIPSLKKEMQVKVTPDVQVDASVYSGTYVRQWPEEECIITLVFSKDRLSVHYELKGGAAPASFDYFNPYIEKDILYCEKNEFALVTISFSDDGREWAMKGLLESDTYFYEKQP